MSRKSQSRKAAKVSTNLVLIVAGLLLFGVGRFVMTGEAYKPPILEGIDLHLGETVTSIGIFLFLWGLISGIFTKPLADAINQRTTNLEQTFAEAQDLREQMDRTREEYEARLKQTEEDARTRIQNEVKKAQELRTQIQAEANAKAEEMLRKAREEIEAERDKVMTQVRVHVANLSLLATERILGENMDNERNRRLVEEFIDKVEVPNR
ncbi:MAG: F0F1 ATP synthase subunit B [Fimbriimonadaceae bacterium]